ncbi:hypothetical protein JCGZ_12741 [Jatropha curcas]|uniref:Uncharacterized protein n=1 Tax=Jatropha curcas TaxID=180498 RepID=A0A067KN67_JATCU|nr:hypothetical protein JCGZ_12741 [Jatropha curcas]
MPPCYKRSRSAAFVAEGKARVDIDVMHHMMIVEIIGDTFRLVRRTVEDDDERYNEEGDELTWKRVFHIPLLVWVHFLVQIHLELALLFRERPTCPMKKFLHNSRENTMETQRVARPSRAIEHAQVVLESTPVLQGSLYPRVCSPEHDPCCIHPEDSKPSTRKPC